MKAEHDGIWLTVSREDDIKSGWTLDIRGMRPESVAFLVRKIEEYESRLEHQLTYCVYCGKAFPVDTHAGEAISHHIRSCPKHPLKEAMDLLSGIRIHQGDTGYSLRFSNPEDPAAFWEINLTADFKPGSILVMDQWRQRHKNFLYKELYSQGTDLLTEIDEAIEKVSEVPTVSCLSRGCGWEGPASECKPSMSIYSDMRCPKCGTSNLDTSDCLAKDPNYGYGEDNSLHIETKPRPDDMCQTCKKREGSARTHHGLPSGTHCDPCWAELLDDYRKG